MLPLCFKMIKSFYKILAFYCCTILLIFPNCKSSKQLCCEASEVISYSQHPRMNENRFEIDSSINISHIRKKYSENPINRALGYFHFTKNEKNYLSYINVSMDSLIFINIIDSTDFHRSVITNYLNKGDAYNCRIINDTLHLINNRTFIYTQLKIHEDFSLTKIFILDLSKIINFKGLYLFGNYFIDKNIEFSYPHLVLTYGDFKTGNNNGKSVYFVIDIKTGDFKKRLDFPDKYKNCELRTPYSISEKINKDYIVTVFPKSDELFCWNIQTGTIKHEEHNFNFVSEFMCFHRDMNRNLAAARKYDLNDEDNSNLIYNGKYIYLIKRLRKETKNEPTKAAVLVFNDSLKHVGSIFPEYEAWPRMSFPYKNGIVLFGSNTYKAYYYVFE